MLNNTPRLVQKNLDIDGRVITVRGPRYFDAGDTNAYQNAFDTYTYTRRGPVQRDLRTDEKESGFPLDSGDNDFE